jgi:hypothetical protein
VKIVLSIFHLLAAASLMHLAQYAAQNLLIILDADTVCCRAIFLELTTGAQSSD